MADKGVSFYDGAEMLGKNASYTTSEEMKVSMGGPIDVPDGIDEGHSTTVGRPANAADGMSQGKGKPISGPMDE